MSRSQHRFTDILRDRDDADREQISPLNRNGDIINRKSSHDTASLDVPDSDSLSVLPTNREALFLDQAALYPDSTYTQQNHTLIASPSLPRSATLMATQPIAGRFAPTSFSTMPVDLLGHIFSYLPLPSLFVCAAVCKRWEGVINDQENYSFLDLSPYVQKLTAKDYTRIISNPRFRKITHLSISGAFDFPPSLLLSLNSYFPRLVSLDVSRTRGLTPYIPEACARLPYLHAVEAYLCDGKNIVNGHPTGMAMDAITVIRGLRNEYTATDDDSMDDDNNDKLNDDKNSKLGDKFDDMKDQIRTQRYIKDRDRVKNDTNIGMIRDEKDDMYDIEDGNNYNHDDNIDDLSALTLPLGIHNTSSISPTGAVYRSSLQQSRQYSNNDSHTNTNTTSSSSSSSSITTATTTATNAVAATTTTTAPANVVAPLSAGTLISLYKAHRESEVFREYCNGGARDAGTGAGNTGTGTGESLLAQQWRECDRHQPYTSICSLTAWRKYPLRSVLQLDTDQAAAERYGVEVPQKMAIAKKDSVCYGGVGWYEHCSMIGRNPHAGMGYKDPDRDSLWENADSGDAPNPENPPGNQENREIPDEEEDVFMREEDTVFAQLPPPTREHPALCTYRDRNSSRVPCRGHVRGVIVWGSVGVEGLMGARAQALERESNATGSSSSGALVVSNTSASITNTATNNNENSNTDINATQPPRCIGGTWVPMPQCSLLHNCSCHNPENPRNSGNSENFLPKPAVPLGFHPLAIAFVCVAHRPELSTDPRLRQCPLCQRYISAADQDVSEAACSSCRYEYTSKDKWMAFAQPLPRSAQENVMGLLALASKLPPPAGIPIWEGKLTVNLLQALSLEGMLSGGDSNSSLADDQRRQNVPLLADRNDNRRRGGSDDNVDGADDNADPGSDNGMQWGWWQRLRRFIDTQQHQYMQIRDIQERERERERQTRLLLEQGAMWRGFEVDPPRNTSLGISGNGVPEYYSQALTRAPRVRPVTTNNPNNATSTSSSSSSSLSLRPSSSTASNSALSTSSAVLARYDSHLPPAHTHDTNNNVINPSSSMPAAAGYSSAIAEESSSGEEAPWSTWLHDIERIQDNTQDGVHTPYGGTYDGRGGGTIGSHGELMNGGVMGLNATTASTTSTRMITNTGIHFPLTALLSSPHLANLHRSLLLCIEQGKQNAPFPFYQLYLAPSGSLTLFTHPSPQLSFRPQARKHTTLLPLHTVILILFTAIACMTFVAFAYNAYTRMDTLPAVYTRSPTYNISSPPAGDPTTMIVVIILVVYLFCMFLWKFLGCGACLASMAKAAVPLYLLIMVGLCTMLSMYTYLWDWNAPIDVFSFIILCLMGSSCLLPAYLPSPHKYAQRLGCAGMVSVIAASMALGTSFIMPLIFIIFIVIIDVADSALSLPRLPVISSPIPLLPNFGFPVLTSGKTTVISQLRALEFLWYALLVSLAVTQSPQMTIITFLLTTSSIVICLYLCPVTGVLPRPIVVAALSVFVCLALGKVLENATEVLTAVFTHETTPFTF